MGNNFSGKNLLLAIDIPGYLGFVYPLLLILCIFMVVYYAEPGFPWHTYLTLIVTYFASFAIMLVVPIDIAVVIINRRSTFALNDPTYNNNVATLSSAYNTFFTILLIFGSFVLVFEEYYNTDGKERSVQFYITYLNSGYGLNIFFLMLIPKHLLS